MTSYYDRYRTPLVTHPPFLPHLLSAVIQMLQWSNRCLNYNYINVTRHRARWKTMIIFSILVQVFIFLGVKNPFVILLAQFSAYTFWTFPKYSVVWAILWRVLLPEGTPGSPVLGPLFLRLRLSSSSCLPEVHPPVKRIHRDFFFAS